MNRELEEFDKSRRGRDTRAVLEDVFTVITWRTWHESAERETP